MALDLNDSKAIDYSSEVPYYPRNAFGEAVLTVLSYAESGPAGSETNKSDKEYDIASVRVESFEAAKLPDSVISSNPKVGETYVLWFQTGGDGVTLKNRAFKAAALRNFVSAACGVGSDRSFDATKGRKDMLAEDFSDEKTRVGLVTRKDGQVKDETGADKPGEFYGKNTFTVVA